MEGYRSDILVLFMGSGLYGWHRMLWKASVLCRLSRVLARLHTVRLPCAFGSRLFSRKHVPVQLDRYRVSSRRRCFVLLTLRETGFSKGNMKSKLYAIVVKSWKQDRISCVAEALGLQSKIRGLNSEAESPWWSCPGHICMCGLTLLNAINNSRNVRNDFILA